MGASPSHPRVMPIIIDEDNNSHGNPSYVPGSIVRIKLENFVTYDAVEFRPGPYLNMVLGPNGTGKSTIACAICIGLGWPPSVSLIQRCVSCIIMLRYIAQILGRSSEINAYVKHGADKGFVEIELKGKKGKPNLIIRRNISSKNRNSQFTLNGRPITLTEIKKHMAKLNVQVENLWYAVISFVWRVYA